MSKKMQFVAMAASFVFALFMSVSIAQAYCGPGFTSKASAIKWYQTSEGKKYLPSLKRELIMHGLMHQDQDVMAFLKSDSVVYTKTPKGYVLGSNTFCVGVAYRPYNGKYKHSKMGVLAVRKKTTKKLGKAKVQKTKPKLVSTEEVQEPQLDGSVNVYEVKTYRVTTTKTVKKRTCYSYKPFMKGYCRNVATGEKWKVCKTKKEKTKKRQTKQKKTLVRTIPAPTPAPEVVPEVTPEVPPVAPPPPLPPPTKDGTTTPTPPTTAPGPNPAPSPQDPAPGGHMCYDEVTGSPVSPVNGLCPPGSFGG